MTTLNKFVRPAGVVLAATLGFVLGACGPASEHRMNKVCKRYCDHAVECDDNTDWDDCVDNCVNQAMDCDSDQDVAAALDILNDCSAESCNNVAGCTVDAWVECNF
jgi:hypothetical protein